MMLSRPWVDITIQNLKGNLRIFHWTKVASKEQEKRDDSKATKTVEEKPCCKPPSRPPRKTKVDRVKITVVGANSTVGQLLSLQMKQNPLVKELRLFDSTGAHGVASDLRHISTPCRVLSFVGDNQIKYALKKADIVVLVGGAVVPPGGSSAEIFLKNAPRIKNLAFACLRAAPEAIFAIFVEPINSNVPLFAEVFRQNGVFTPNKVLGGMALDRVRARTLTAAKLGLDPSILEVQVVGGASPQTVVPVITGATPGGQYLKEHTSCLIHKIRAMNEQVTSAKQGVPPVVSLGYSVSTFIDILAKGVCEENHEAYPALVRTNTLDGVKYLATPLTFGPGGVLTNLGLPRLSRLEMDHLEAAIPFLKEDIQRGEAYMAPSNTRTQLSHSRQVLQPCFT